MKPQKPPRFGPQIPPKTPKMNPKIKVATLWRFPALTRDGTHFIFCMLHVDN